MTFKANWEKTAQHGAIKPDAIAGMIAQAFPDHLLVSHEVISGGCGNLNIKVVLEKGPYILRVYLRDKEAAYREYHIASLLKYDIPIPEVLFIGDQPEGDTIYRFAITQFMEGIPLRDLLLSYPENAWRQVMVDVGEMLCEFRRISFPHADFPGDLANFAADCLNNPQVQVLLDCTTLQEIFQTNRHHLPNDSEATLVHGDFDPSNILVHQVEGKWQISAILDWEFSFAGSWLWDVANMLRYAHQMPKSYEQSFLEGLEKGGLELPENWRITIALLNIASLLDLLARHSERPILRHDACQLIEHMVEIIKAD